MLEKNCQEKIPAACGEATGIYCKEKRRLRVFLKKQENTCQKD